jgi:hypothetical protein
MYTAVRALQAGFEMAETCRFELRVLSSDTSIEVALAIC